MASEDGMCLAERSGLVSITGVRGPAGDVDAEHQFRLAYECLGQALSSAGLTPEEVGRVTVVTPDASYRPLINPGWKALFVHDDNRPARRTTHAPLPGGHVVELEAVCVRGERRWPVEIEGVRHKDPLPMGAVLGPFAFSSAIVPDAPGGTIPDGLGAIHQSFENLHAFVEAAGGTLDDVANLWVYLGRWDLHDYMVDTWVETFPDEHSRPSRKTFYYPRVSIQLQCEAVLGGGRENYELEGLTHRDPIPMATRTGGLFTTSGVDGRDPVVGKVPRGVRAQADQAIDNLHRLLAVAGLSPPDLVHVTALVGQLRYSDELQAAWDAAWPDKEAAPALTVLELGLPARDFLVQVLGRAIDRNGAQR